MFYTREYRAETFCLKFHIVSNFLQYANNICVYCLYIIQGEKNGKYLFWNLLIDLQSISHKAHPSKTILRESLCLAQ